MSGQAFWQTQLSFPIHAAPHLPAPFQGAHPAAAGTTQPGPTLAPVSPSSREVKFDLFFPDGSSPTSTKGPRPITAQTCDTPKDFLSLPHKSPLLEGIGKSCHKPCPHPSAPCPSPKSSCRLLGSHTAHPHGTPSHSVGGISSPHLSTGQAAGRTTCLRRDQMEGREEGQGWGRL